MSWRQRAGMVLVVLIAGVVGMMGVAFADDGSGTGACIRVVDVAFINVLNPVRAALWGTAPTC
jgi:hypothetical protein